ncbi:reverse transcriptase domain, reverse transcriptase zinc-binding domain protein [Tanacetum coccineum]
MSFGGRLTLVKSVLGSLPLYYFLMFRGSVLSSFGEGGLNVGSLRAKNLALLDKKKETSVMDIGGWVNNRWVWEWDWGSIEVGARALRGRLPVRVELDRRGIDLDSVLYPSCNDSVETCAHSLITCDLARSVWDKTFNWWKVGGFNAFSVDEVFSLNGNINVPIFFARVWQAVLWTTRYFIWKERNVRVFGNKSSSTNKIFQDIQLKSYEWIVRRSNKYKVIDWQQWLKDPIKGEQNWWKHCVLFIQWDSILNYREKLELYDEDETEVLELIIQKTEYSPYDGCVRYKSKSDTIFKSYQKHQKKKATRKLNEELITEAVNEYEKHGCDALHGIPYTSYKSK